jgi:hypothetical protein
MAVDARAIYPGNGPQRKHRLRFLYCCMTSLPERTPKKTNAPSIVALLSNGCKQAFPLLTVDLQRARHNIIYSLYRVDEVKAYVGKRVRSRIRIFHFQNALTDID